jgi:lipid A 3-O-deacylase
MDFQVRLDRRNVFALLLAVAAGFLARTALGQGVTFESAGVRYGFSTDDPSWYHQSEAFVDWNLPWKWDLGKDWTLQTRLDVSGGTLWHDNAKAAVATAGPVLAWGNAHFPVWMEGGSSPTFLSRYTFGPNADPRDFGCDFQFTSHIGIYWDIVKKVRVGYRFQHMSNAHIQEPNPGLNLNVFYASYLF